MMQIDCPFCGTRDEIEFTWGGEAHLIRPIDPNSQSDEQWASYLFTRKNPNGLHHERWVHTYGCGQWFNVIRDTQNHEIIKIYPITSDATEVTDD